MSPVLGLTGASGYIGQAVIRIAIASGWQVVAIGRHPISGVQSWRHADLGIAVPDGLVNGLDAVLHLAANTDGTSLSPTTEIGFAYQLAVQARAAGIPFVFCSSQAAAPDAPSDYGSTKFSIEQRVRPLGAVVIRPGLVIGGSDAGLFGLLVAMVRASPLLPVLLPRPMVQPIHVDDLAATLLACCKRRDLAGRVLAAVGKPVAFDVVLAGIARYRLRTLRPHIPIPIALLRGVLALARPVLGARLSPARLDSLLSLPLLDARDDLLNLGVVPRPLAAALNRNGRGTRSMLHEAHALARATTGVAPPPILLRRYVRLLRALGNDDALSLPPALLDHPSWLAALDAPGKRQLDATPGGLLWRMNVIVRLAEAQPALASRFLMMPQRSGIFAALLGFATSGLRELQSRIFARLARQLAKGIR